jgi:hypothetical protein
MDSAQLPAPQLGRILIAAGLLTEAQLAQALEEQTRTGRRLGEIIVRRGFVSGPALANALAEQHGGVLKTEYGFATGLGGQVAQRAASEAGLEGAATTPTPLLRTAEPTPATQLRAPDSPVEPQEAAQPPRPAEPPQPVQPPQPAEPPRPVQPPQPVESPRPVAASVEPAPPPEAAPPPEPVREPESESEPEVVHSPEPEPELAAEPEPEVVAGVDPAPVAAPAAAQGDERDALIESLRTRIDAQDSELAELRAALEEERARNEVQVHVWPEEQPVAVASPAPAQQERYLVCVPTSAGYVLFDRVGTVPTVGEEVAVPEEEGEFTVTKVVRLPRNGRACAYLQRA